MNTSILGLGTATPDNCMSQVEALEMFHNILCETERQQRLARALFRKSQIENRHLVVPYKTAYTWCQPASVAMAAGENFSITLPPTEIPEFMPGESAGPTTGERMKMYAQFAGDLAFQSAKTALGNSGISGNEITHLVVVTCTGFNSPGVDIELINRLGLPNTTQRVNVGFMGCHAAINGLRTALAITQANPNARVLLCCVEICSLHYRFQWDDEGIIGNALFADGSASMVLGQWAGSISNAGCEWKLLDSGSIVIPDSEQEMSWKVGDHGFEMKLTSEVGDAIENSLREWLVNWLRAHDLEMSDIDHWGVHPGGPRILSAVEKSLGLDKEQLQTSHSVLRQYGNMSSPTVLFILNEFMVQLAESSRRKPGYCLLLAFGPGLVAEIALIQTT